MRRPIAVVVSALLLAPLFPASASARVVTLTEDQQSEDPALVVTPDGTGHVFWRRGVASGGDEIVYCRLPRGASACQKTQTFKPDDRESFHAPAVFYVPDERRITVVVGRCCNENAWTWSSTDGGETWSDPVNIGTLASDQATLGPGPGAVMGFAPSPTGSGPVNVQVASLSGPKETRAVKLSDPAGDIPYSRSIAFVDSTTPLVTWDDLTNTFFRVFDPTKGSDYFDADNYGPIGSIPGLDESTTVSGPGGTVIVGREGQPGKRRLTARRFDPASRTFGPPQAVDDGNGDPIFSHAFEDPAGGIHLAYIRNGEVKGEEDSVMWVYSPDGGATWRPPVSVGPQGGYNLRVGAAGDHGGWVLTDNNSGGPIRAFELAAGGPPAGGAGSDGGGSKDCKQVLQVTPKVQARAQGGCWSKVGATAWTTKADARINGLDFLTGGSGATVTVDTAQNTIATKGGVTQKAGAVLLNKGALTWDLDGATKFTKVDAFGIKLLGFAVTGEATVTFQKDQAKIETNIELPSPLDAATGATTMVTTMAGGLKLDGLQVKVASTDVGPLGVRDLVVTYTGGGVNTLEGSAKFLLPPQQEKVLQVGFGFKDGKFAHAEIPFYNGPPLPLPLATGVTLNSIGFGVSVVDGFQLDGSVGVGAAAGAIGLDGSFRFLLPAKSDVAELTANGKLKVFSLGLATGRVAFRTDGLFEFGGNATFGPLSANVAGGVQLDSGTFFASGDVSACLFGGCATGKAIVSSIGAAAGVEILGTCIGGGIKWPDTPVAGCSVSDFKPAGFSARALRQAGSGGAPLTVPVPPGQEQAVIRVRGDGGVPAIGVSGPGVEIASDPADASAPQGKQGVVLIPRPDLGAVEVTIQNPQAGAFSVTGTGGAAIAGVDVATGGPLPAPKGTLSGKGRSRTLSFTGAAAGEVSFVERGADGLVQQLGTAKATTGKVPFTITDGPAGRRTVEAVVTRGGVPRSSVVLATFTAPGPITPGRPRVTLRRRGSRLAVSWTKASRATRYRARVRVSDGRALLFNQGKRTVSVPRLERGDRVSATVQGVSSHGRRGRAATATLGPVRTARRR